MRINPYYAILLFWLVFVGWLVGKAIVTPRVRDARPPTVREADVVDQMRQSPSGCVSLSRTYPMSVARDTVWYVTTSTTYCLKK